MNSKCTVYMLNKQASEYLCSTLSAWQNTYSVPVAPPPRHLFPQLVHCSWFYSQLCGLLISYQVQWSSCFLTYLLTDLSSIFIPQLSYRSSQRKDNLNSCFPQTPTRGRAHRPLNVPAMLAYLLYVDLKCPKKSWEGSLHWCDLRTFTENILHMQCCSPVC